VRDSCRKDRQLYLWHAEIVATFGRKRQPSSPSSTRAKPSHLTSSSCLSAGREGSGVLTLVTGDYGLLQCPRAASIERKTIADLVSCLSGDRPRFEHELLRMRGYPFRRLVVVGLRSEIEQGHYRSRMTPKAVLHSLASFEVRYNLPIC
jgi:ERCC4-type nuclease